MAPITPSRRGIDNEMFLCGRSALAIWDAGSLLELISTWVARTRQRRALAELDDRLLRDIGVTRNEAEREISKWFWE